MNLYNIIMKTPVYSELYARGVSYEGALTVLEQIKRDALAAGKQVAAYGNENFNLTVGDALYTVKAA
jgi:hypothetical protein